VKREKEQKKNLVGGKTGTWALVTERTYTEKKQQKPTTRGRDSKAKRRNSEPARNKKGEPKRKKNFVVQSGLLGDVGDLGRLGEKTGGRGESNVKKKGDGGASWAGPGKQKQNA